MAHDIATKVLSLLDEERAAIRSASFDALPSLTETKSQLFAALEKKGAEKADLAKIQAQLTENQTLLASAIAGENAARGRIAALQNVREGLSVYDQSGQMATVRTRGADLQKKA